MKKIKLVYKLIKVPLVIVDSIFFLVMALKDVGVVLLVGYFCPVMGSLPKLIRVLAICNQKREDRFTLSGNFLI